MVTKGLTGGGTDRYSSTEGNGARTRLEAINTVVLLS